MNLRELTELLQLVALIFTLTTQKSINTLRIACPPTLHGVTASHNRSDFLPKTTVIVIVMLFDWLMHASHFRSSRLLHRITNWPQIMSDISMCELDHGEVFAASFYLVTVIKVSKC